MTPDETANAIVMDWMVLPNTGDPESLAAKIAEAIRAAVAEEREHHMLVLQDQTNADYSDGWEFQSALTDALENMETKGEARERERMEKIQQEVWPRRMREAVEAEREACARVAETMRGKCEGYPHRQVAAAIRARGER